MKQSNDIFDILTMYSLYLFRTANQWPGRPEASAGAEASHKGPGRVHRRDGSADTTHLHDGLM